MRLFVVSDLHNEFDRFRPPAVEADVVVLAGDIDVGTAALDWACQTFAVPVIYVAGNHEFYRQVWQRHLPALEACAQARGVHFLEQRSCVIGDVRFLGTTLWTDFALFGLQRREEAYGAAHVMTDFRLIGWQDEDAPARRLVPADTVQLHEQALAWLTRSLATPFAGQTVVVTHHLPHWHSVLPRWQQELSSAGFASDLHALIERYQPELWIHGHTHDSLDYRVGRTRIVCNPRGYMVRGEIENPAFQADLVIAL